MQRVKRTKTVCTYCGVGCSFDVWTRDRHILKIEPAHGPANGISTCVKGKFAWDFVNSDDRLDQAAAPRGRHLRRDHVGRGPRPHRRRSSRRSKREHGPDALAFIASSKCTNEESYLMQKLARAVIGTNNIDNCSRYCQTPATMGLQRTVGYGGDSGSISDIETGRPRRHRRHQHRREPSRARHAHQALAQASRPAAHRRRPAQARDGRARRHLPPPQPLHRRGLALRRRQVHPRQRPRTTRSSSTQWVNDFDEYRKSSSPSRSNSPRRITGIPSRHAHHRRRRDRRRRRRLHPLGHGRHAALRRLRHLDRHLQPAAASPATTCAPAPAPILCAATTTCRAPATSAPCPTSSPAISRWTTPDIRAKFEAAWGVTLPTTKGLDNHEMIDAIHRGQAEGAVHQRRRHHHLRLQRQRRRRAPSQARVLRRAGHHLLRDLPLRRRRSARRALARKGRHLHQHRAPHPAPLPGASSRSANPSPTGRSSSTSPTSSAANWNYKHPSDIMDEIARAHPAVRRRHLRAPRRLQDACSGRSPPTAPTRRCSSPRSFHFPDGKASFYPLEYVPPSRRDRTRPSICT